jgi:hypothetical protein
MHRGDVWVRDCRELNELRLHVGFVSETNDGAFVAHLIAVVGSAEDSNAFAIVLDNIAFVLHFVRANHKLEIVGPEEILSDVWSE